MQATDEAKGCVLEQEQDRGLRVLAYATRALQLAKTFYCLTRKETAAENWELKYFRHLLNRRKKNYADDLSFGFNVGVKNAVSNLTTG